MQKLELGIGQVEQASSKFRCKYSGPRAVIGVIRLARRRESCRIAKS